MRRALSALVLLWSAATVHGQTLPIHLEESHAGAFYHLVETLPLSEAHTLVLVDAHSDANGIANSDDIRAAIRRGPTVAKRAEMFREWRRQGRIQCYNWLEPLLPAPISQVIWIPAIHLEETERARLEAEAREYLDAHQEALPRDAGPLASRYQVRSLEQFESELKGGRHTGPLAASIDLDFFAKTPDAELTAGLDRVMNDLLGLRELKALTFAVSSPYLRDSIQGERLAELALAASWRVPNATVTFEPFAPTGPDKSLMARLLERQGKQLPRLDLTHAGPALRTLLLQHWDIEDLHWEKSRAEELLTQWSADPFLPHLEVPGEIPQPDGSWTLPADHRGAVVINPEPTGARVRWYALRSKTRSYRIGEADFGFATRAPKWLFFEPLLLGQGPVMAELPLKSLQPALDPARHCGTVHLFAEVERDGDIWRTPLETFRISAAATTGARAAWSRQFMLPYLFDARLLTNKNATGPDTHWGADCATFISAGLRAEGWLLPWGSPKDLRRFLRPVTGAWPKGENIIIDFDSHVAALWEDKPPLGTLNDEDLCVHQLENQPEILPFATLQSGMAKACTMVIRQPDQEIRILIAGDLMLGRKVGALITRGEDPLAGIRPLITKADLAIGNLECVLTDGDISIPLAGQNIADQTTLPSLQELGRGPEERGGAIKPAGNSKPRLLAPPQAAGLLHHTGFDALSIANNHTLDAGPAGLIETQSHLTKNNIRPLTLTPTTFTLKDCRLTLLAWDDSQEPNPAPLLEAIHAARPNADYLIVLPHWGREHQREPTPRQRQLAAAIFTAGANLIAGGGPHIVQPLEHYSLGSIAFSLGNTVFDGPGPDLAWSRGALLEVTLDASTQHPVRMRCLPTKLDNDGRVTLGPEQ